MGKLNSTMSPQLSGNIIECKWKDLWVFFLHEFVVILAGVKNINVFHGLSPGLCVLAGARACGPDPRWLSLTSWWPWSPLPGGGRALSISTLISTYLTGGPVAFSAWPPF